MNEGMEVRDRERHKEREEYLKKGCLGPTLFIHAADLANGHNNTLHVGGHHRLPGKQEPC